MTDTKAASDQDDCACKRCDSGAGIAGASGWSSLNKSLTERDVARVKDVKDDIDTLLVFAGLFSAVLTAFLLESYKTLQVDRTDVVIDLLQRIATQNYTMSSGYLNSTIPPASLVKDEFSAPEWAVRINGLWFASLLCSLSAGSFGILVKQWLREYLVYNSMTTPTRVHARMYRNRALRDWKVFESAAILSPLLQLALLLFFLGMCFFTASTEERVARTTISLVAGWAVIICLTTITPFFYPGCPWKTPWLKPLLKRLSKFFFPERYLRALAERFHPLSFVLAIAMQLRSEGEDEDVAKSDAVASLLLVDETMQDDELLEPICEAFQSSQPQPSQIIPFVTALIRHRLGPKSLPQSQLSYIPNLSTLSLPCWLALTDLVGRNLSNQLKDEPTFSRATSEEKRDAVLLLLSPSPFTLPPAARRALNEAMTHRSWEMVAAHVAQCQRSVFVPMAKPILDAAMLAPPRHAMTLYAQCLCHTHKEHGHFGNTGLLSIFRDQRHHADIFASQPDAVKDLFNVLCEIMTTQVRNLEEDLDYFRDGSMEAFTLISEFWEKSGCRDAAVDLARGMWQRPTSVELLFLRLSAVHKSFRIDEMADIIPLALLQCHRTQRDQMMLSFCQRMLERHVAGKHDFGDEFPQFGFIRLCHVFLRIAAQLAQEEAATGAHIIAPESQSLPSPGVVCRRGLPYHWDRLWQGMAKAIERFHTRKGWTVEPAKRDWIEKDYTPATPEELFEEDRTMAEECLQMIPQLDADWPCASGAGSLPSLFPEELITSLRLFIVGPDETTSTSSQPSLPLSPLEVASTHSPTRSPSSSSAITT